MYNYSILVISLYLLVSNFYISISQKSIIKYETNITDTLTVSSYGGTKFVSPLYDHTYMSIIQPCG